MKRNKIVKYIIENDCIFYREGGNHTIFMNPETLQWAAVPRHTEIDDILCNKICKQLGIPKIK
ncbi:MAG: type II toxin-antitoxin system HicA family toxin [Firmicutes bacterium]|nr:type II toxin-antitoxin system HicA family toxin [Bacillota bacterium]